jgi:hypothetical protein
MQTRLALAAAALVVLTGAPAAAQSNAAIAEQMFREGQQLLRQGRFSEACEKLAASQRLDPAIGTLMNLAYCHELEGKTASAWSEYSDAAAQAARAAEPQRQGFAREHAAALEPTLSKMRIEIAPGVATVEVRLDGVPLPPASIGPEVPVDPGEHVLEASAPGKKPWRQPLHVAPGRGLTLARVELEDDAAAGAPAQAGTHPSRTLAYVLGGVGVATVGVGVALLVRAYAFDRKSNDEANTARQFSPANPVFVSASLDDHQSAVANQTAGLITAAVGAAVLGAGAYFYFARGSTPTTGLQVVPELSPGRAAMSVSGAF